VKLKPMIKMEVEKELTLKSVEREKMNQLLEHAENKELHIENNKEIEKGDNPGHKSQKVMGKEISIRACMLMILLNFLAQTMLRMIICFWKSTIHEKQDPDPWKVLRQQVEEEEHHEDQSIY